jgi:hypothetical protein
MKSANSFTVEGSAPRGGIDQSLKSCLFAPGNCAFETFCKGVAGQVADRNIEPRQDHQRVKRRMSVFWHLAAISIARLNVRYWG